MDFFSSFGSANAITTAAPRGDDGYEHFVSRGSCRRCGLTAFGKRKCQQCQRKFCHNCAPMSLQKYGEQVWEECCIGCEPYLVVAPPESEPIFELEPESEEIITRQTLQSGAVSSSTAAPIHVPLSATYAAPEEKVDDKVESSTAVRYDETAKEKTTTPNSTSNCTLSTEDDSSDSDKSADGDNQSKSNASTSDIHDNEEDGSGESFSSCLEQEDEEETEESEQNMTVTEGCRSGYVASVSSRNSSSQIRTSCTQNEKNLPTITPPLPNFCPSKPEPGCCIACHQYSSGKQPCLTCGTKYCQQVECLAYLNDEGTCIKCVKEASRRETKVVFPPKQPGCCAACQQYAMGKTPCQTCGTKYCSEEGCQVYLYSRNGTCVLCCREVPANRVH